MGNRSRGALMVMTVATALVAAGSCTYAPNFADDTLQCSSDGQCPKGYSCALASNTCSKTGGTTANHPEFDSFIGTWTFASGTTTGSCTDGSTLNGPITPNDFVVITTRSNALVLEYFCDTGWTMTLSSGRTTATANGGQTCRFVSTDPSGVVTTFDWGAKSLTFSTSDGLTATTNGHLAGPFTDSISGAGTCDLMFDGALTKD